MLPEWLQQLGAVAGTVIGTAFVTAKLKDRKTAATTDHDAPPTTQPNVVACTFSQDRDELRDFLKQNLEQSKATNLHLAGLREDMREERRELLRRIA